MSDGKGRRWLRAGCFGCLGLVGVAVLSVAALAGLVWFQGSQERMEERRIEARLTEGAAAEPQAADGPAVPRRVVLDLADGGFEISPTGAGEPLSVEASFDASSYELTRDETTGAGGEPVHEIRFHRTRRSIVASIREILSGKQPQLKIQLPKDVPIALELRVSRGGAEIDLGGLWLTDVEFHMKQGGGKLAIAEPLREPVGSFVVRASMGGMGELADLGNASPRKLDIDGSMGGFEIDLRGAWRADSEIDIKTRMGGATVRLPRDVNIVGLEVGSMTPPPEGETSRPTLRFTTSSQMDDVEIIP